MIALALTIKDGGPLVLNDKFSYTSSSKILVAIKKSKTVKAKVKDSYGPVCANAYVEVGISKSEEQSTTKQYAHAEKKIISLIVCLNQYLCVSFPL